MNTEKAKPASHEEVTGGAKENQYGAKGQQGDKKKHTSGKHDRTHHGKSSEHKKYDILVWHISIKVYYKSITY